jgi:hypothetical protein
MERDPLSVLREVRASLDMWLEAARKLPDPSSQPPDTAQKLSEQIRLVSAALRDAPEGLSAGQEWKREIALYAETLRELRARLHNFEITLRIRHQQMREASANLGVARRWSDLAKHIG